ncbi:MAG TPA: hypothetical protein VES73_07850 [Lamprocystis sp. (in: g-proteobacteria)]|nr:hypothetical protein [Lamprocystis sp. (in: g-proteobacteria)]
MTPRLNSLAAVLALSAAPGLAAEAVSTLGEVLVTTERGLPLGAGSASLTPAEIAPKRARTSDTTRLLLEIPGMSAYGAGGSPACRSSAAWRMIASAPRWMAWTSSPPAPIT